MLMVRCSTDEQVIPVVYDSPSGQDIKKSASALDASSSETLMGGTINSDPGLTDSPDAAPAERHQTDIRDRYTFRPTYKAR
jgi:hypothetical protein